MGIRGYGNDLLRGQFLDPSAGPADFAGIESLYIDILESAYTNLSDAHDTLYHDVVGAISVAKQALSPNALLSLVSLNCQIHLRLDDIIGVVSRLCSIMTIDASDNETRGKLRVIHPSFASFIVSTRCPRQFSIYPPRHQSAIGRACLVIIRQRLTRNACHMADTSVLNSKIGDLPARLMRHLPDDLHYACQFWVDHICSSHRQNEELYALVKIFLCEDLRNWLEVLSLLSLLDGAPVLLMRLQMWIEVSSNLLCC